MKLATVLAFFIGSLLVSPTIIASNPTELAHRAYNAIEWTNSRPKIEVFELAIQGFRNLQFSGEISEQKSLITIVDFSLPSSEERMWIIDLKTKKVLFQSLVAHGRNSGNLYAKSFSNTPESYQSSIGFYRTAKTYHGKHGLSLRLDGLEEGWNNNARDRAIVLHGAKYVSKDFVNQHGRLGRSHGCPAVPVANHKAIINTIKERTCFFIYYPDESYLNESKILQPNT
ncbi:murein L,D-transpeptidase catalytic domain family protein [Luteibaculum oceani]|uniref:Murein L,D-transpeptidase catalytic domain family protein n=1 Tax=Luteibaculum oceani TaxID=1294296 RepID=A0A5C6V2B8_9FLAO|nr:murein L,D-transpeptidase catalytic domain family protein [Luteibaculum oceani]TXC78801.1 murein L,D-transpeptidase catalytic domain family protein [Luteibaculum oceani]